jgi:hypothetical protein
LSNYEFPDHASGVNDILNFDSASNPVLHNVVPGGWIALHWVAA